MHVKYQSEHHLWTDLRFYMPVEIKYVIMPVNLSLILRKQAVQHKQSSKHKINYTEYKT